MGRRMASTATIGVCVLAFLLIQPAWSQLTPHLTGLAITCLSVNPPTFNATNQQWSCDIGTGQQVVSSGVASVNSNFGSPTIGAQATENALGSAAYGVLRASSSTTFNISRSGGARVWGDGFAAFDEVMTIGGPFCGTTGFLSPQYTLSGSVSGIVPAGPFDAFAEVFIEVDQTPLIFQRQSSLFSGPSVFGTFAMPADFQFTYCKPFGFQMWINAVSGTVFPGLLPNGMPFGEGINSAVGQGAGAVDFSHTVVLSGLQVFDSQMNPVNDATFTSASGTPYTSSGVGLPVMIEINPGEKDDDPPSINPTSRGHIPVAILSSPTFDAPASIDTTSLTFGHLGIEHSLAFCNHDGEDVNGDGLPDLVCHFATPLTGFHVGDKLATLRGQTITGTPIVGTAAVRVELNLSD